MNDFVSLLFIAYLDYGLIIITKKYNILCNLLKIVLTLTISSSIILYENKRAGKCSWAYIFLLGFEFEYKVAYKFITFYSIAIYYVVFNKNPVTKCFNLVTGFYPSFCFLELRKEKRKYDSNKN